MILLQAQDLSEKISKKKRELDYLVTKKKNMQDEEIYQKSVELDDLIVEIMRQKLM